MHEIRPGNVAAVNMQQDQCVLTLLPVAFFFPAAFIHPSLQYPFLFVAPRISRLSSCLFPFRLPAPHRARFERLVHGRGKSAHNAAHCRVYHLCQNGQPKRDRMAALHGGGAEWSDYWQWIQPGYRAARRRGICMRRHLGQGGVPSLALIDCSSLPFTLHSINPFIQYLRFFLSMGSSS